MLNAFSQHRRVVLATLVLSALIAIVAAEANTSKDVGVGVAATQVVIDFPQPSIVERRAWEPDVTTLVKHAELYGRLLTSELALHSVAQRAGVPANQVSGVARLNSNVPQPLMQPESEVRASQIDASKKPYRLGLQPSTWRPILYV